MKNRCLPLSLAAVLVLALAPSASMAQASAPPPIDAASAPPATTKPGPRLLTPAETRDSATPPGDLRPERPVTPQISIPLGRAPPAPSKVPPRAMRSANPASAAAGIDDAVARCEAEVGEQVRAKCRDQLARQKLNR
jgi:hypothetical protein